MRDNTRTGFRGELLIHELLQGSVFPNQHKEQRLPYDIEWQGIKIDVKTTANTLKTTKHGCGFTVNATKHHADIVLVFVALLDKNYFWVSKYSKKVNTYKKLDNALTAEQLPEAISKIAGVKVEPPEKNPKSMVRIDDDLFIKLQKLAKEDNRSVTKFLELLIIKAIEPPL